jgi:DNA invertase Pin-like site-specific DNA recombinase
MKHSRPLIPYLRQSRRREKTISIDEQRRDIERWAEANDVALAAEIVEQGVSGSKSWRQRELGAGIEACERGDAAGVIVAWQDRLSRENGLGTAEVWDALDRAGARLVCAAEGLDTATGDHELTFSIKAAIARDQWKRHRANWVRADHSAWERGLYVAEAPAGFERQEQTLVKTVHAEAVADALRLRAGGGSWTEVARLLTAKGVPTSKGRLGWSRASAKAALRNPVFKGDHACTCGCGAVARRPEWALVPPSVWRKAQPDERIGEPAPVQPRWKVSYDVKTGIKREELPREWTERQIDSPGGRQDRGMALLGGLMRCSCCGGTLTLNWTRQNGKAYGYYRCKGRAPLCKKPVSIAKPLVEPYIIDAALWHLGTVEHERPAADTVALQAAVEQAEADLAEVEAARDELSPLAYGRALDVAQQALDAARDALAEADPGGRIVLFGPEGPEHGFPYETAEAFERLDVAAQRALLRELIQTVRVERGRGPVVERVQITLNDGSTYVPPRETTSLIITAAQLLAAFDEVAA